MAFTIVSYSVSAFVSIGGGNTNGIDTTGADFLVLSVCDEGSTTLAISDQIGGTPTSNVWTPLTSYVAPNGKRVQLFWSNPVTVGNPHTVFALATGSYATPAFQAFTAGSPGSLDQETGFTQATGTSTIQPGSLTPSVNDCLVVTALNTAGGVSSSASVDSGFTQTTNIGEGASNDANMMAYLIQTTATASNPTWTVAGGLSAVATAQAVFQTGGTPSTGNPWSTYAQMRRQ